MSHSRPKPLIVAGRAGADLETDQGEELLGGADHRAVGQPCLPVGRGQAAAEVEQAAQRVLRLDVLAQQVGDPALQAARAAAAPALGTQDPAPQVGRFYSAQMRSKCGIGGIEQVMALVEYVAKRAGCVVQAAHCGLNHHQRVVGDHDIGLPGAADGALDEALLVVLAGRIDAFAAPVGQRA